ncbi:MAG: VCBS repeat-containing protein [SAR324 cluster bacterium]|nr:VCBS repeat-containing protein [SAR324 cluster bacterium]
MRAVQWPGRLSVPRLLSGILLGFVLAVLPLRAEGPGFQRYRLPVEKETAAVFAFDLTGNGHKEILTVEVDRAVRNPVPHLRVFTRNGKGFDVVAETGLPLPASLAMLGVGRFPEGPALVMLMPGQLQILPWKEGRFRLEETVTIELESINLKPGGDLKTGLQWIVDLDGDGFDEIAVPRLDGLQILRVPAFDAVERHVLLLTRSKSRLWIYLRQNIVAYSIPVVHFLDIDGRDWKDVVAFNDGLVQIFYLGEEPGAMVKTPDAEHDLQPPKPFNPDAPWDPPLKMVKAGDLNGDGTLDLVFVKIAPSDSGVSTSSRVLIYYGRRNADSGMYELPSKPDQVFATEGFSHPLLVDINNNGRTDLALVNVEIGFWAMLKALIARTVSAETAFYLMPKEGRYPRQPDAVVDYSVKFSLGRFSHQPLTAFGDFNGDGRPDLLLSVDKSNLGIHWGLENEFWDDDYDYLLEDFLPTRKKGLRVTDLDGDGRDDLIFTYNRNDIRQMPEVNHKFTVLLSRFALPVNQIAGSP